MAQNSSVTGSDPAARLRSWREQALALARERKWREATAMQRALVSAHDGRAPKQEMRDRYRLLRWQLSLGAWRDAIEEIEALYPRLTRRRAASGPAAGWLFLARAVAQFQIGWGPRSRRSLAMVLRVARRGDSVALLRSALVLAVAFEQLRRGAAARTEMLERRRRRLGGVGDARCDLGTRLFECDDESVFVREILQDPQRVTLLRLPLPRAGFAWSRLVELVLGPQRLREWLHGTPDGSAPEILDAWLAHSEADPTETVPPWLAPRLARELERAASELDAVRRQRIFEAVANLSSRFTEPWSRAELLAASSDLSLWCVEDGGGPRAARQVARARAELGLAAGLFRQIGLERRAQECEDRWLRLIRTSEPSAEPNAADAAVLRQVVPAGSTRRVSLETIRRRSEAAGFVTADVRVLRDLSRLILLAPSPLPVLILGESGTGKEVVARAIHRWSTRPGDCIAIHCGAIPRDLLESELFGHARGAFTGAAGEKPGLVEAADGGTLFLDEIGEMGMDAQMKMLRVLESGEVRRVGDLRARRVLVRLVAATHRDLDGAVREGRFRLDLLHRIRGITITLPPLRERRGDIPRLIERFLFEVRAQGAVQISDGALAKLLGYPWPGNVRELRATTLRAAYFAQALGESRIGPELIDFPGEESQWEAHELPGPTIPATDAVSVEDVARTGLDTVLERLERRLILQALEENGWNRTRTAERLGGLSRTTLLSKMKRLGIEAAPSA
ncbi:MAG: sigma-54 dependent transcriptional regulator [Candidatus Eisenbacteria bacterium]|uniref:Sigma-54-dependent Fis family transcriptional regulator n=1 Tax=Eiseniibacteriota bacterium TaxID=2212470 RepID=A0A956LV80_UNCEI|nr:sigma-54-dependent Fis family transcriptional regulator [Candidatus Eisenbacteria bacterium]